MDWFEKKCLIGLVQSVLLKVLIFGGIGLFVIRGEITYSKMQTGLLAALLLAFFCDVFLAFLPSYLRHIDLRNGDKKYMLALQEEVDKNGVMMTLYSAWILKWPSVR